MQAWLDQHDHKSLSGLIGFKGSYNFRRHDLLVTVGEQSIRRFLCDYLTPIRHDCALPGGLRELIIMPVMGLNGAPYDAQQYAYSAQGGRYPVQLDALGHWETSDEFDAVQRAVLGLTYVMTRDIHVPDEIFAAVAAGLGDPRLVVEAVATIAACNMVSRFLEALQISSQDLV
jgi:alkylhydroperoxidase family enzyme